MSLDPFAGIKARARDKRNPNTDSGIAVYDGSSWVSARLFVHDGSGPVEVALVTEV